MMNMNILFTKKKIDSIKSISHQNNYKRFSRSKAIRLKCLDCCANQHLEVRLCTSYDCPLWRYRMGKEERDELYYQNKSNKYVNEVHT